MFFLYVGQKGKKNLKKHPYKGTQKLFHPCLLLFLTIIFINILDNFAVMTCRLTIKCTGLRKLKMVSFYKETVMNIYWTGEASFTALK